MTIKLSTLPADSVQTLLAYKLISAGLATTQHLTLAFNEQAVTGEPLTKVLNKRGIVSHSDLMATLLSLGPSALAGQEVFSSTVPASLLHSLRAMVVAEYGKTIYVGTTSTEGLVSTALKSVLPDYNVVFIPVDVRQLGRYLEKLSKPAQSQGMLDQLLSKAVERGVSDIHIYPKENSYQILFRYLGVRYHEHEGPLEEYQRVVARIKDRSGMDLAERRIPQDGSFSVSLVSKRVDFRAATVPVLDGEYVTIRVLDPDNSASNLDKLGITRKDLWRKGLSRADGLCLVCGPTGSGKTTTLNASVRELDRLGSAVFSVEDPVEYRTSLVAQVSVNQAAGMDFAKALKAFMRADPDVIVLGEIRDLETARTALKAAETGHLVLATLHTESIIGALQRLQDIGVSPVELKGLLRAVLVQRLTRVPCSACKGEGCPLCNSYGYTGRTLVSECQYFSGPTAVQAMINGDVSWKPLLEDAVDKALRGETTTKEIYRIFGEEAQAFFDASSKEHVL